MKPWKSREAIAKARALGWIPLGTSGGHAKFTKDGALLVIPVHPGDLKTGTQRSIMRTLGIRPDEL